MKRLLFTTLLTLITASWMHATEDRPVTIGFHALAGGRYDNVRMCVGSPRGVKGGPIMDVYLDIRFPTSEKGTLVVNMPIMRPILFGAAFEMLQFEPQLTYEHMFLSDHGKPGIVLGGGLGMILHYGPDYNSTPDDRGESFFSMGPLVTGSAGIVLKGKSGTWIPGIKIFYSPLFSPGYTTGHVAGAGVEFHYQPF